MNQFLCGNDKAKYIHETTTTARILFVIGGLYTLSATQFPSEPKCTLGGADQTSWTGVNLPWCVGELWLCSDVLSAVIAWRRFGARGIGCRLDVSAPGPCVLHGLSLSTDTCSIWLSSSVYLEGLYSRLYHLVGKFLRTLEERAVSVPTYKNKPSLL